MLPLKIVSFKHIILIGFKSVGKSSVAHALAKQLSLPAREVDVDIERLAKTQWSLSLTCRQIMAHYGEAFFRQLESQALNDILASPAAIVATGGGTILSAANRQVLSNQLLIHLTMPKACLFERIRQQGIPAFFHPSWTPWESFTALWEEREPLYRAIRHVVVDNSGDINRTISHIINVITLLK